MLICDPSEFGQTVSDWPVELICNGKVVIVEILANIPGLPTQHWNLAIDEDAHAMLVAPTDEGVVRCVTVIGGIARPMGMHVPTLTPGG